MVNFSNKFSWSQSERNYFLISALVSKMGQIMKTIYKCNYRLLTFKICRTLLKMPQIVSLAQTTSKWPSDTQFCERLLPIHVVGKKKRLDIFVNRPFVIRKLFDTVSMYPRAFFSECEFHFKWAPKLRSLKSWKELGSNCNGCLKKF